MGFLEKINRGYSLNKRLVSPYELMDGVGGGDGGQEKGREGREGDKKCPLYSAFLESFYLIKQINACFNKGF